MSTAGMPVNASVLNSQVSVPSARAPGNLHSLGCTGSQPFSSRSRTMADWGPRACLARCCAGMARKLPTTLRHVN
eukprot:6203614-Pyramimonas_sp.AAC.1